LVVYRAPCSSVRPVESLGVELALGYHIRMNEDWFFFRITKDRKVFIGWHGRPVTVLKGRQAERLIGDLPGMSREQEQLALAFARANFMRGNERPGR
jgi:hypothetical protein